MSMVERLRSSPAMGLGVAAAVIALAAAISVGTRPAERSIVDWFYDAESGDLYTADNTAVPPIAAPSGEGNGYLAYVFTCGECANEADRFVGWVLKYTEAARLEMINPSLRDEALDVLRVDTQKVAEGTLIAAPPQDDAWQWVVRDSDEGRALMQRAQQRCETKDGSNAERCRP